MHSKLCVTHRLTSANFRVFFCFPTAKTGAALNVRPPDECARTKRQNIVQRRNERTSRVVLQQLTRLSGSRQEEVVPGCKGGVGAIEVRSKQRAVYGRM